MIGKIANAAIHAGASAVRDQVAAEVQAFKANPDLDAVREKVGELVGMTFFGKMLEMEQDSPLKSDIMHGGRGEEIFRAQLNQELSREAGRSGRLGIGQAIAERLVSGLAARGQQDA